MADALLGGISNCPTRDICSVVAGCKLCGIDPFAYLRDVLARISTHPASRVEELLPRNWKPAGL